MLIKLTKSLKIIGLVFFKYLDIHNLEIIIIYILSIDLLVLTVASEKTDGFKRLIDSANLNGLKTKVNIYFDYL